MKTSQQRKWLDLCLYSVQSILWALPGRTFPRKHFKLAFLVPTKTKSWCHGWGLRNRSPKKFWQSIRKSKKSWLPSTVGGETGNKAVTVMSRKHFSALLNSSKNCGIGNFVHQNIISHGNFEGIDELMCNSFKIKSLLHKLPLNRAAGKDSPASTYIYQPWNSLQDTPIFFKGTDNGYTTANRWTNK